MPTIYGDFETSDFWENSDYASKEYVGRPLTDAMIRSAEDQLGYRLPAAYIELLHTQNGGMPRPTNHRTSESTSWAEDHVAITGVLGLDPLKRCSLCGTFGSKFWEKEWRYPAIGVYFSDCPSAGHDMLCLDYRQCGPKGEPRVVHVDQEFDFKVTEVAENFEQLIRGLVADEEAGE